MRRTVEDEQGSDAILSETGRYVAREWHGFIDATDGEIFEIEAGDILELWYMPKL